jgi:hypothetical protein
MTDKNIQDFLTSFQWYRDLSLALFEELAEEQLTLQVSERSLTLRAQFIDLGILQVKILELLSGNKFFDRVTQPDELLATKEDIIAYLADCNKLFIENILQVSNRDITISWFGRMSFTFEQALHFLLAHEAMHHGEMLSCIFANNIEMPSAFKKTWGFEL